MPDTVQSQQLDPPDAGSSGQGAPEPSGEAQAQTTATFLPFELTTEYMIGVAIGTAAVILFCYASFNKPAEEFAASEHESLFLPREQTGHIQYLLGFGLYLAAFVTGYLLLCAIGPKIGYDLLSLIPALSDNGIDNDAVARNFPIYLALLLIGVIPGYEKLNIFERSFRRAIHRRASIPTAMRSLVRRLREDEISRPSPVQVPDEYLLATDTLGQDNQPQIDSQFGELWNRLAFLFYRYRYRGATLQAYFSDDFIVRHARITDQIHRDFVNLHRILRERDKRLIDINDTAPDSELYTRTQDLYDKLCHLVAGTIIQKCGLSTKRYQALHRIGYVQELSSSGSSIVVLAVGFIMLWVVAGIMILAADEEPFRTAITRLSGSWTSGTETFLSIIPFMLRQFILILVVFGMYNKKMHAAGPKDDVPGGLGYSVASGLPVYIGGATLSQLVYYMWAAGVQFAPATGEKYAARSPYWIESMMCGIALWILFYFIHNGPSKDRAWSWLQIAGLGVLYGMVAAGVGYFAFRLSETLWIAWVHPEAPVGGAGLYALVVVVLGSVIGMIALATAYVEWGLARERSSVVYQG